MIEAYQGAMLPTCPAPWVFAPLASLQPDLARGMVEYRFATLARALDNARQDGYEAVAGA